MAEQRHVTNSELVIMLSIDPLRENIRVQQRSDRRHIKEGRTEKQGSLLSQYHLGAHETPQCRKRVSERSLAVYIPTMDLSNPTKGMFLDTCGHRDKCRELPGDCAMALLQKVRESSGSVPHTGKSNPKQLQNGAILRTQPPSECILSWGPTASAFPHPQNPLSSPAESHCCCWLLPPGLNCEPLAATLFSQKEGLLCIFMHIEKWLLHWQLPPEAEVHTPQPATYGC